MEKNVGPLDARLRVVAGTVLAVVAVLSVVDVVAVPFVSALGLGIVGGVLIVEGLLSRCLLYRILGIDRCPVDS